MKHFIRVFSGMLALAAMIAWSAARADEGGEKIYQRVLRSTTWILAPVDDNRAMSGSGSLIDVNRRLVLTNHHVVGDADKVIILFPMFQKGKLVAEKDFYRQQVRNSNFITGKVVLKDSKRDLALVQLEGVPKGVQALPLAAKSASPGQKVHSVGNPGSSGALWIYTSGTVRQVYHKTWKVEADGAVKTYEADVVETQSPTNPGDSGGPLVNDKGELVAVTQGGATNAQLVSFFVDISEVRAVLAAKGLAKLVTPPAKSLGDDSDDKPKTDETAKKSDADLDKEEKLAAIKLNLAKKLAEDGINATARYQDIVKTYPKTKAAEEAKQILDKMKKK